MRRYLSKSSIQCELRDLLINPVGHLSALFRRCRAQGDAPVGHGNHGEAPLTTFFGASLGTIQELRLKDTSVYKESVRDAGAKRADNSPGRRNREEYSAG